MRATPHLMLNGTGAAALEFWGGIFPDLRVEGPRDGLYEVTLGGLSFTLFDSPTEHAFGPTPSWSLVIDVETAEEVDTLHERLSEGGETLMPVDDYAFARRFAWVEDRFGVSWQVRYLG
ncbi:MAG: VOC family protein [Shimia sp.]